MFNSLVDLVARSEWAYLLVAAVAALDAVFPVVPSEATVITAAALASSGRLSLPLVLVAAAAGAAVGDNGGYALGRLGSSRVRRLARSSRVGRGMEWAKRSLAERGATIVVVSRFVPGGRTGTMLAAGVTRYPWRRFVLFDLAAAACWAGYAGGLGALGGVAFADRPLAAVGLALSLAAVLAGLIEAGRRLWRRLR
jgi:membrane protein DedA with SNARE-associated domain